MNNKKKIGIGITTRNRQAILDIALRHFEEYLPENYSWRFVVVDDFSDNQTGDKGMIDNYPYVTWIFKSAREGIAAAKNSCLSFLRDCDYIFLFDDDCFPNEPSWHNLYIDAAEAQNIHHMVHLEERGILRKITTIGKVNSFENCAGCMLFITKQGLETIGGFNKNFGTYGYEHLEYSIRAHRAGLSSGCGRYVTPVGSEHFIYSIDLKAVRHSGLGITSGTKIQPSLATVPDNFSSSMTEWEKESAILKNSTHFSESTPIYQEL